MAGRLSEEETRAYWRDGYVVARGLFTPDEVKPWLDRSVRSRRARPRRRRRCSSCDGMVAKQAFVPPTPEHAICKINFFENDPTFMSYARHPVLLDCVESLLGTELLFVNSMVITKPPGVDGRHPLHQDLLYFGFRPGDAVVGTWTAIEPVSRANGCLAVLPGSHRGELLEHGVPDWDHVNFGFFDATGVARKPSACTSRWRRATRCSSTRCFCTAPARTAPRASGAQSRRTTRALAATICGRARRAREPPEATCALGDGLTDPTRTREDQSYYHFILS